MARVLVVAGAALMALGLVVWTLERVGITPGRLPGDIVAGSGNTRIYIPITTCILLSIVLSAGMYLLRVLHR
jgi:hypothetical protein